MVGTKILQGSGLDDQTENEFYKLCKFDLKELRCHFIRRKDKGGLQLHPQTEYLIVRGTPKRSEKLLSSLARGILILPETFLRKVIKEKRWCDATKFDIGLNSTIEQELHIPLYAKRKRCKQSGGMFKGEHVVVLYDDIVKQKYERIMTEGGAKVLSRTVQHLADRYVVIKGRLRAIWASL